MNKIAPCDIVGSCRVRLHLAKCLTGFKVCATTLNKTQMQQDVQTDATCNIQQGWEFLANNVAQGLERKTKNVFTI